MRYTDFFERIDRIMGVLYSTSYEELNQSISDEIRQAIATLNVQMGSVRVIASPQVLQDWWDKNPNTVRVIQTFQTELDEIQHPLTPGKSL